MRRLVRLIPAALGLAGLICLTTAAFLVWTPLGLAVLGLALIATAITLNGAST